MIRALTGEVTVRYEEKGQPKVETDHLNLPPDLSNGVLLDVLKNVSPEAPVTTISYLATTPKPRLIRFVVKPEGEDSFRSAGFMTRPFALRFMRSVAASRA